MSTSSPFHHSRRNIVENNNLSRTANEDEDHTSTSSALSIDILAIPSSSSRQDRQDVWDNLYYDFTSRSNEQRNVKYSSPECKEEDDEEQYKRRRIQQACKSCSLRRVKCNGQKPCRTCPKTDEICTYGQPKKRGPVKGTKRALRTQEQTSSASSSTEKSSELSANLKPRSKSQSRQDLLVSYSLPALRYSDVERPIENTTLISPPSLSLPQKARFIDQGGDSDWEDSTAKLEEFTPFQEEQNKLSNKRGSQEMKYPVESFTFSQESSKATSFYPPTSKSSIYSLMNPPFASPIRGIERKKKELTIQDDRELEPIESSLAAIFQESHEAHRINEYKFQGRRSSTNSSQGSDCYPNITLSQPSISEEIRKQAFQYFWVCTLSFWPVPCLDAFQDESSANIFKILEDYRRIFGLNALPNGSVYFLFM